MFNCHVGFVIDENIHGDIHGDIHGSVSKPRTPVVHIKIAGKWMFIPLKMGLIGIDPYPPETLVILL